MCSLKPCEVGAVCAQLKKQAQRESSLPGLRRKQPGTNQSPELFVWFSVSLFCLVGFWFWLFFFVGGLFCSQDLKYPFCGLLYHTDCLSSGEFQCNCIWVVTSSELVTFALFLFYTGSWTLPFQSFVCKLTTVVTTAPIVVKNCLVGISAPPLLSYRAAGRFCTFLWIVIIPTSWIL